LSELTPLQQRTQEALGSAVDERQDWDPTTGDALKARLLDSVADLDPPGEDALFVSKARLTSVLGCEVKHQAEERAGFRWTVPTARGAVAHKAVELLAFARAGTTAVEMVDETVARAVEDRNLLGASLMEFLQALPEFDLAQLRSDATRLAAAFIDVFPPLKTQWAPVAEPSFRVELLDGALVLSGQPDLVLGRPEGLKAKRVVIDWKSGAVRQEHLDDLRYYAVLVTMRQGIPPLRVGTVYLDSGNVETRPVDDGLLEAGVRRTAAGVRRLVELAAGAEPVLRPGPACGWCPVTDCETGRSWLQARDEGELEGWEDGLGAR
jgi:PD-(D/E)XK nuclease superfamily